MSFKLQAIATLCSIGFMGLIFELVRRKQLKENYSLAWFFVGGGLVLLSLFGNHLEGLAELLGFIQLSNAIIVYAIFLILVLALALSVAVTRITDVNQKLVQEVGILKRELEELKQEE